MGMNLAAGLQAMGVDAAGHFAGRDKAPFRMMIGLPPAVSGATYLGTESKDVDFLGQRCRGEIGEIGVWWCFFCILSIISKGIFCIEAETWKILPPPKKEMFRKRTWKKVIIFY